MEVKIDTFQRQQKTEEALLRRKQLFYYSTSFVSEFNFLFPVS